MNKYCYNLGKSTQNFKRLYNAQDLSSIHRNVHYINQIRWLQYLSSDYVTDDAINQFITHIDLSPPRTLIVYLNIDPTERNRSTSYRSLFEKLSESTKHKILNNVAYDDNDTPLELAVSSHMFDCDFVKFLIKNGAKVTHRALEKAKTLTNNNCKIQLLNELAEQ